MRTQAYGCKLNEGRFAEQDSRNDRVPMMPAEAEMAASSGRGVYDIACWAVCTD